MKEPIDKMVKIVFTVPESKKAYIKGFVNEYLQWLKDAPNRPPILIPPEPRSEYQLINRTQTGIYGSVSV